MGQDPGRRPARVRWVGRFTGLLVVAAGLATALIVVGVVVALDGRAAWLVALLGATPTLAAWLLHRRLRWLLLAGPEIVTELRTLADRGGQAPAAVDLRRRAETFGEQLSGSRRRPLRTLWRTVRVLRAPVAEGVELAQRQLGASDAALSTTVRALERSVGLVALAWAAAVGTGVAGLAGIVLLIVGVW